MKKVLLIIPLLLLINYMSGQTDLNALNEKLKIESDYSDTDEGVFYVIIPLFRQDASTVEKRVAEYNDQKGKLDLRVKLFWIEEIYLGQTPLLIIRRFEGQAAALSYVEEINTQALLNEINGMPISQMNYRKFLKKRDIEAYKNFLGK